MSYIGTVNKLSRKKNLGRSVIKKGKGVAIKTSKQKLITINQFDKCSFIFQQARPIECAQHNSFNSSIMSSQIVHGCRSSCK